MEFQFSNTLDLFICFFISFICAGAISQQTKENALKMNTVIFSYIYQNKQKNLKSHLDKQFGLHLLSEV